LFVSTCGEIYSGVLDLSEGRGDITKKALKENEESKFIKSYNKDTVIV
jgi:hypothetical protein